MINYSVSKVRALIEAGLMPGNLPLPYRDDWVSVQNAVFFWCLHTWKHSKNVVTVRSARFDRNKLAILKLNGRMILLYHPSIGK